MGTVWLQYPTTAAENVVEAGKLKIGWVLERVEALPPHLV